MIAGLTGRRLGDRVSQSITTGLLILAFGLSCYVFFEVIYGAWTKPFVAELAPFIQVGAVPVRLGGAHR